jgi:acyl-coenzyme A thioesterase PaaI-like protein
MLTWSGDMNSAGRLLQELFEILHKKFGEQIKDYLFPPPIFVTMRGELLEMDLINGALTARFPILESYLNPYGAMQGGMIAAAVDNTLGPLSVAIAPPNVTRILEMKYSRPVRPDMEYIVVQARLVARKDPQLIFAAKVISPEGDKLASCKAIHWIIDNITI